MEPNAITTKELGNVSPSKLETARLCEARLLARLTDEDYEEEQGSAALGGILAHCAAKIWYRFDYPKNDGTDATFPVETPDQAFDLAMKECANAKNYDGTPLNELSPEFPVIVDARNMFDMIISNYRRDVVKVLFAERRYKGHLSNGVPVHLIIDLIVDRGGGTCEIIDFKTGFLSCSEDEMYDKDQVLMNLLAVSGDTVLSAYPYKKFTYFWVRQGFQTGPVEMPPAKLKIYEDWLALEYQRMLNIKEPKESINRFCKSCGRKDKCKKFGEFVADAMGFSGLIDDAEAKKLLEAGIAPDKVQILLPRPKLTPEMAANITDEALMAESDKLKGQIDLLDERQTTLKKILLDRMNIRKCKDLIGDKFKARIQQNKREGYAVETVLALCGQYQVSPSAVLSVQKSKVDAAFADNQTAMANLQHTAIRGATQPFIMISPKAGRKRISKTDKEGAEQ